MNYLLKEPPAGLVSCRVNAKEVGIASISADTVELRLPKGQKPGKELVFSFYDRSRDTFADVYVTEYVVTEREDRTAYSRVRFQIRSGRFRELAELLLADYNQFAVQRVQDTLAGERAGYPAENDFVFDRNAEELRQRVFQMDFPEKVTADAVQIAIAADTPEKYAELLRTGTTEFYRMQLGINGMGTHPLAEKAPQRVYLGNRYCRHLLPEQWHELLEMLYRDNLPATIVLPPVSAGEETRVTEALEQIDLLAERLGLEYEVEANDWGTLKTVSERGNLVPVLGLLLNKLPKDPRSGYVQERPHRNFTSDRDAMQRIKEQFRLERAEYDDPQAEPTDRASLHFPWYQTNTGLLCPLRSVRLYGKRIRQEEVSACERPCVSCAFGYPKHLKMMGVFNSLFAFSDSVLLRDDLDRLPYDRVVLEFL